MTRGRAATVAALALLALVVPAAPPVAAAEPEGGPELTLAWDGTTRTSAQQSFVGVPVAVPGDRAQRGLTVVNDGPTDGTLRAWVTQVDLRGPDRSPPGDDGFFDDLRLGWASASQSGEASFRALADAGSTLVAHTRVARGAATRIEVTYELPVTATTGNRAVVGERAASFVLHVQLEGRTAGDGVPAPTVVAGHLGGPAAGGLAVTGLDVPPAALVAVVAIGAGTLLLAAARRRRRHAERGPDVRRGAWSRTADRDGYGRLPSAG